MDVENPGFDSDRYFLGSLCKRDHDWFESGCSLRKIKKNECVECKKLADKKWKQDNPEKVAIGRTKYNQQERVKEYKRNHWTENAEKYKADKHQRYEENKREILEKSKSYNALHRDKILQYLRDYHQKNRDKCIARSQKYYAQHRVDMLAKEKTRRQENRDEIQERRRRYRQSSSSKMVKKASDNRRRAKKNNNHAVPYSKDALTIRLDHFCGKCAYCGDSVGLLIPRSLTWDHFISISRGGSDCLGNLVPACGRCNSSKSDRDPLEWYESQHFFNPIQWGVILSALGKTKRDYKQIPLL